MPNDFLKIGIDPSGALRVLEDHLRHMPVALGRAREDALEFLRDAVRAGTPVDQGIGRDSVRIEEYGTSVNFGGRVVSDEFHMLVLEEGRTPGKRPPPTGVIEAWLERQGADPGLAFVVARAIGRRGTPPHKMFAHAYEKGKTRIPSIYEGHVLR